MVNLSMERPRKPMERRFAFIGDIHGDLARLRALVARQEIENRHLVFLGDYVDRGPDSRGVLDFLIRFSKNSSMVTLLRGNHEIHLEHYLKTGDFSRYATLGGIATIKSYVDEPAGDIHRQFIEEFPQAHLSFLESLADFWENNLYFASHAGIDPEHQYDKQLSAIVLGEHRQLDDNDRLDGQKTHIVGHFIQKKPMFKLHGRVAYIDTGCGTFTGGQLTALLMPERLFVTE